MLIQVFFPHSICSSRKRLLIGLLGALAFIVISIPCLTAQGIYYDEISQAPASFAYKGLTPQMFCISFHGVPVLNAIYVGAIKSTIYGLYLKVAGADFTVTSWRLLGIAIIALGIFLFFLILPQTLSLSALILFLFLLETDLTVLLGGRHDFGPIALALFFRLLFVALWIRGEYNVQNIEYNTALLGIIAGVSICEKLTSSVFLVTLVFILLGRLRNFGIRHLLFAIGGTVLGAFPSVMIVIFKFHKYYAWLTDNNMHHIPSTAGFLQHLRDYLSLGGGYHLKSFILGVSQGWSLLEWVLMGVLLLISGGATLFYHKENKAFHLASTLLLSYGAVGLLSCLLPLPLWVHHFIIGTPLQYAAFMLCHVGFSSLPSKAQLKARILSGSFLVILSAMMVFRVAGLFSLEHSFFNRDTSLIWDHSLTDLGSFAACRKDEVLFIAADWGVAAQIYCLSQGKPGLVNEIFWNYQGVEELNQTINTSGKNTFYLVTKDPLSRVRERSTLQILEDAGKLPGWHELPPEEELAAMKAIRVRKFMRIQE
ncbi:MAG: hypothetical protein AB2L14_35815 [Candidatus Xenobiia bacterium LiM19]